MDEILQTYEQPSERYRKKVASSHVRTSLAAKEHGVLHGTWQFENMMLSLIRDGEVERLRSFLLESAEKQEFNVGTLAADPLRQAKNMMIGLTAIVGKIAGIGGGMSVEDAYWLIDLYTQECEKCVSVDSVTMLQYNMLIDFTERVRQAKLPEDISREIFEAVQYIAATTTQDVSLDEIAAHVGMSRSYLTRRFRQEMGTSVNAYVTEMKLRDAERFLLYSDMTLGQIASFLSFSSQAYFQTVFRKARGVTPGRFRQTHGTV